MKRKRKNVICFYLEIIYPSQCINKLLYISYISLLYVIIFYVCKTDHLYIFIEMIDYFSISLVILVNLRLFRYCIISTFSCWQH